METVVSLVAPGAVIYYAMTQTPKGWLECDGSEVSIKEYYALYEAIGDAYGGASEQGMFKLPDLRGEFIRGLDKAGIIDEKREIGSKQKGSLIGFDSDYRTSELIGYGSENGIHDDIGIDKVDLTQYAKAKSAWIVGTSIQGTLTRVESGTGATRPHNIALLACIKY